MNNKYKKRFIYTTIILAPALLLTLVYGFYNYKIKKEDSHQEAERIASIHQKQMDQIIGETIKSLEVLAITFESNFTNLSDVKKALQKTSKEDPRYGGLYFLDSSGNVISGTNDYLKQYNLRDKDYIQTMSLTHRTVVSDQVETLLNNQNVIAIVTPVIQNDKIRSILVAHIRTDYIGNIIQLLTPNRFIQFESDKGVPIFSTNNKLFIENNKNRIVTSLESVPWKIAVIPSKPNINSIFKSSLLFLIVITTLIHVFYLFFHSLAIKRQAERERIQNETQKLELVGALAASTAHEIRNPLTGIKGLVQLLSEKYNQPQDQYYFSVIDKEIDRINQIVNEFLILGKPTIQKLERIDFDKIISDLNPIIISEANLYNVKYEFARKDKGITVLGSKDQFKQVILNITKNALESMPGGGTLTIQLEQNNGEANFCIKDSGNGISDENLKKIFTPFFTSKDGGTGLGLVVCKRIIESFNGKITIASQENKGTEVLITLPLKKDIDS